MTRWYLGLGTDLGAQGSGTTASPNTGEVYLYDDDPEEISMTGGPIFPCSAYPVTAGRVFPNIHVGAGSGSKYDDGLGVEASVGADATWALRFQMPPGSLPSGTCELRLLALANATSGAAKVNPKWASVAVEEDPSSATLNAEGTQTLTWGAGDNDQYKSLTVTLDADTPVAGEILVMSLVFETSGYTLAQVSTWQACVRFV